MKCIQSTMDEVMELSSNASPNTFCLLREDSYGRSHFRVHHWLTGERDSGDQLSRYNSKL